MDKISNIEKENELKLLKVKKDKCISKKWDHMLYVILLSPKYYLLKCWLFFL